MAGGWGQVTSRFTTELNDLQLLVDTAPLGAYLENT